MLGAHCRVMCIHYIDVSSIYSEQKWGSLSYEIYLIHLERVHRENQCSKQHLTTFGPPCGLLEYELGIAIRSPVIVSCTTETLSMLSMILVSSAAMLTATISMRPLSCLCESSPRRYRSADDEPRVAHFRHVYRAIYDGHCASYCGLWCWKSYFRYVTVIAMAASAFPWWFRWRSPPPSCSW